ncbi:MAG: stage III sporulation protein AD [Clostridia bacterium]|nr:stage III sporulation protein AD [Clostridia bacterium]
MQIVKVVGVGLIGALIAGLLRQEKSELFIFAVITTGALILIILLSSLTEVIKEFGLLVGKSGVDESLFAGVLKIIGVGYITEYASAICVDQGVSSIANKLQLAGKVAIFFMTLPILTNLVDVISSML